MTPGCLQDMCLENFLFGLFLRPNLCNQGISQTFVERVQRAYPQRAEEKRTGTESQEIQGHFQVFQDIFGFFRAFFLVPFLATPFGPFQSCGFGKDTHSLLFWGSSLWLLLKSPKKGNPGPKGGIYGIIYHGLRLLHSQNGSLGCCKWGCNKPKSAFFGLFLPFLEGPNLDRAKGRGGFGSQTAADPPATTEEPRNSRLWVL